MTTCWALKLGWISSWITRGADLAPDPVWIRESGCAIHSGFTAGSAIRCLIHPSLDHAAVSLWKRWRDLGDTLGDKTTPTAYKNDR